MNRPLLAVTIGDPAGVGPETIVGAWASPDVHGFCRPFVVGHPEWLRRAGKLFKEPPQVVEIQSPEDADPSPSVIPCLTAVSAASLDTPPCVVDKRGGQTAYEALVAAAKMAIAGQIAGLVTAPLCKEALHAAGHYYPGHTELLAELCGVPEVAMMLYLAPGDLVRSPAGLGVAHVTLHVALRDVWKGLTEENILAKTRLCHEIMQRMKGQPPRIAACALNPHAGEHGLFGDEEATIIAPAIDLARREGIDVTGPLATDTLFAAARNGAYDGVVAMYHDQGHIALKLLGFHRAVNITLGLPILRTSVAHGTAFDLAWQGQAEYGSMIEALRVASVLAAAGPSSPNLTGGRMAAPHSVTARTS